jgi:hypothetical protein
VLGVTQLLAQTGKRGRIAVVAVDVAQTTLQAGERVGMHAAVSLDAVPHARLQLLERPAGLRHADDGELEVAVPGQRLEGGKNLLVGEIAGRPEEHQRVGRLVAHQNIERTASRKWR